MKATYIILAVGAFALWRIFVAQKQLHQKNRETLAQMLADTDEPVGLIAEQSGFSSHSHFNTLFREKYKMTLTEYRKVAKELR